MSSFIDGVILNDLEEDDPFIFSTAQTGFSLLEEKSRQKPRIEPLPMAKGILPDWYRYFVGDQLVAGGEAAMSFTEFWINLIPFIPHVELTPDEVQQYMDERSEENFASLALFRVAETAGHLGGFLAGPAKAINMGAGLLKSGLAAKNAGQVSQWLGYAAGQGAGFAALGQLEVEGVGLDERLGRTGYDALAGILYTALGSATKHGLKAVKGKSWE